MTAAATNYVYLDPLASCAPTLNTSGFGVGQIPIAVVVTNGSGITTVNDVRSWFSPPISMDSTGRSIVKGLNGAYFADQLGDKSTTGIASAISACGISTPCRVVVPGSYLATEAVPGSLTGDSTSPAAMNPGTTSPNIEVEDFRLGDQQTAINPQGPASGHRPWHQWVANYYTPAPVGTYQSHTNFATVVNAMDGGSNLQGAGYYAKSGFAAHESYINCYTPGDCGDSIVSNKYSPGDSMALFLQNTFYGGQATAGEEGAEVLDAWLMQGSSAYQGTITSGGTTGATSLTLSPTAGAGTQGAGRYLLDTTSGKTITAGTISAISCGGSAPCSFTGSGTSWPVSTVNTTSTQAVSAPGVQTVSLASTSGITTSTVLVFADAGARETITPTAVGSGSITANFTAPHASGAIVCSGGLSGYFVELTADTVSAATSGGTALRQAFPVLCSSSSTSMTVYVDQQGTYSELISGSYYAWSNTTGQNGYVLYPGAQVLSVYANGAVGNNFTLMPNIVAWANSDTVELPQHPANGARLGSWNLQSWWPAYGIWGPDINFFGVNGYGTGGILINNWTPTTMYQGGGGNLAKPRAAFQVNGPWGNILEVNNYGPSVYGLVFGGQKWGSAGTVYPILVSPASGASDYLAYLSPKTWLLTAGSQSGTYSFGPTSMSVPGLAGIGTLGVSTSAALCNNTTSIAGFNTVAACTSLRKFKTNIKPLPSVLRELGRLKPVSYKSLTNGHNEVGFIAEEVNKVDPRLSTFDKDGKLQGVQYDHIVALLTKAIQEQQAEIETLKKEIADIRAAR